MINSESYFQKYLKFRRKCSRKSQGKNGLKDCGWEFVEDLWVGFGSKFLLKTYSFSYARSRKWSKCCTSRAMFAGRWKCYGVVNDTLWHRKALYEITIESLMLLQWPSDRISIVINLIVPIFTISLLNYFSCKLGLHDATPTLPRFLICYARDAGFPCGTGFRLLDHRGRPRYSYKSPDMWSRLQIKWQKEWLWKIYFSFNCLHGTLDRSNI